MSMVGRVSRKHTSSSSNRKPLFSAPEATVLNNAVSSGHRLMVIGSGGPRRLGLEAEGSAVVLLAHVSLKRVVHIEQM